MSETATPPEAPQPTGRDEPSALPPWFIRGVGLVMLAAGGLFVAYKVFLWLRPLLLILLVAFFLALAAEPAVNALARRGWRRGLATLTVFLLAGATAIAFTVTIGGLLLEQLQSLVAAAPGYVEDGIELLNRRFDLGLSADALLERVSANDGATQRLVGGVAGSAFALAGTAVGMVFSLFTVLLFAFYLVTDAPRVRLTVQRVLPRRHRATFVQAWAMAVESTGGYLYSRALLAVLSTAVHAVALGVIGVPNAFALGLWVGLISQLVPSVGTYLGGVLPVLVALVANPVDAIWVLAVIIAYQQIENYVISPPLTSRTMSLHPAVAFGAVIVGALVLGPVGALLALPAAAMVQAALATWGDLPTLEEVETQAREEAPLPPARRHGGRWRSWRRASA